MELAALKSVLVLLTLSVAAVAVLRRVHLPPILGYLVVGIAAGPYAFGWLPDTEVVRLLAEIGVVFLLFSIGLEFSIPQMLALRRVVFGVGGAQVVLSTLGIGGVLLLMDFTWQGALVAGGALAMSSTAIAAKQLSEQLEMQSRHGRLSLGVLLFQDVAVVPFLVIIPILAGAGETSLGASLAIAMLKGAVAFGLMLAAGHWLLRPVFHAVARARSAELFTLTVLLISLAAATVTSLSGLSLALGAFLAGMMLGETEYRHQIEADIRPFRDVLMALFFITIGFELNLRALPQVWDTALLLLVLLLIGKSVVVALLVRIAGYESGVALRTGLVLAQAGEFSVALLALALHRDLISNPDSQALLAAVIASMAIAPLLIRHNGAIAKKLFSGTYLHGLQLRAQQLSQASRDLREHVIICGFGRIGQNLARFLRNEGIAYVALDLDPALIKGAWEAGERVFYGNAAQAEILDAAGIDRARALVVTFDNAALALQLVRMARAKNPSLPLLARTRDDARVAELESAGATVVVPQIEASMNLATLLLQRLGVASDEVARLVAQARYDQYRSLRGYFRGAAEEIAEGVVELRTVVLPPGSYAIGRTLGKLELDKCGVTVEAVCRGEIRGEAPDPEMKLAGGDALILEGEPSALEHAEARLLKG
jgi:CPA2 family monovalent cation:H+ antiporter-2